MDISYIISMKYIGDGREPNSRYDMYTNTISSYKSTVFVMHGNPRILSYPYFGSNSFLFYNFSGNLL